MHLRPYGNFLRLFLISIGISNNGDVFHYWYEWPASNVRAVLSGAETAIQHEKLIPSAVQYLEKRFDFLYGTPAGFEN